MIIGLIVFFLYLYFFVGFKELLFVVENLNSADYVFYYSLAVVAMVLSVLFVAAAWQDLLKSLSVKVKLRSVFLYTWVGYFVDLLVPCQAVCGEVTRIYLVHRENRESFGPIAASSLTNRIISYFITSAGLLTGIVLVLTRINEVPLLILQLLVIALIGTGIYLAVLFYLAIEEKAAGKVANVLFKVIGALRLSKYLPADLPERTQASLMGLHQGFKTVQRQAKAAIQTFAVSGFFSAPEPFRLRFGFLLAGVEEHVHGFLHNSLLHRRSHTGCGGGFLRGHAGHCFGKSVRFLRGSRYRFRRRLQRLCSGS